MPIIPIPNWVEICCDDGRFWWNEFKRDGETRAVNSGPYCATMLEAAQSLVDWITENPLEQMGWEKTRYGYKKGDVVIVRSSNDKWAIGAYRENSVIDDFSSPEAAYAAMKEAVKEV